MYMYIHTYAMPLYIHTLYTYIYIYIYIRYATGATGTRGIAVTASALEKPGTWVRLPASVIFFICSVASFLLCCPCEALEGPIS